MALLDGVRPEKRTGQSRIAGKLGAIDPHIEGLLRGLPIDPEDIGAVRRTGNTLWRWRNEHDVRRRRSGMFVPNRLLDKGEADRLLKLHLAALAGGGQ